jgi:Leucine-rich repeat (LRR) protein
MGMQDREIVKRILSHVPAHATFDQDRCIGLDFTDEGYAYCGLLRNHPSQDKVLELIGYLNLKHLNLRKCRLKSLPDYGHMMELEHLRLGSNYLGYVPQWIRGKKLRYLDLGVNELTELPYWISEFPLETLKVHKNKIREIPNLSHIQSLKFLNLYLNRFKSIPTWVFDLANIEVFSWGISGVTIMPEEIGSWKKLTWLTFVANKIKEVPDSFCELHNLVGARLHKNKLEHLPNGMSEMKSLKQLTLYRNNLSRLPDDFHLIEFDKLNIGLNSFESKPKVQSNWLMT